MEDRHYLSEPRLSSAPDAAVPTWDVDVMREGVDAPILTLQIDKTCLPPRKSKKKVVWKLPDASDTLPKFGQHEKKRILELFKERKKELKKSKRRASQSSSPPASGSGPVSHEQVGGTATKASNIEDKSSPTTNSANTLNTQNGGSQSNHGNANGAALSSLSKKPPSATSASSSPSPPPGLAALSLDTITSAGSDRHQNLSPQNGKRQQDNCIPPPPSIQSSHRSVSLPETPSEVAPTRAVPSQATISEPPINNGLHHSQHAMPPLTEAATSSPLYVTSQSRSQLSSLPPSGRCFVVPPAMAESSPAALGSIVAEAYYMLLQRGLVAELASYYSPDAQKSLTVGGAYAACVSAVDRSLQLQSLAGNIKPHIKAIQQQLTLAGGVMLMITGFSIRPPQGFLLPFCHTIVLCPVATSTPSVANADLNAVPAQIVGYQIQNDNLVFLTGDDNNGAGGGGAQNGTGMPNGGSTSVP